MPRPRAYLLVALLLIATAGSGAVVCLFAATIPLDTSVPPIAIVRREAPLLELPSSAAPKTAEIQLGGVVFVRCLAGRPAVFGPWVSVSDPHSGNVGWMHGASLSKSGANCPAAAAAPAKWRLRERRLRDTTMQVVLRFGPSDATIATAVLNPVRRLWTDGRYVETAGERWVPVITQSGARGWLRSGRLVKSGGIL
jgi:hypothetical protein